MSRTEIRIPKKLDYEELSLLLQEHFNGSIMNSPGEVQFDWRETSWVCLPEIVSILSWSSKLVKLGCQVAWLLPDPRSSWEGLGDVRFHAQDALGAELFKSVLNEIEDLKVEGLHRKLYPNARRSMVESILKRICARRPHLVALITNWLDSELASLEYLDVLAFLNRYQVFQRAEAVGIRMIPDFRTLPKSLMSYSRETACLELRPIYTISETEDEVNRLCEPEELKRVLGEYASLDVVRRGALAQILVNELGRNVGEHADGSCAWLCTRLVTFDQLRMQTEDDPATAAFRTSKHGFLEIIVCDNGSGLASKLPDVLKKDTRRAIMSKYRLNPSGTCTEGDLIDYAFDRLSSSKRDISKLIHLERERGPKAGPLASGLYWVWNLVRSHHGVLAVRTGSSYVWYDFFGQRNKPDKGRHEKMRRDPRAVPFCGTLIRICLPLSRSGHSPQPEPNRLFRFTKRATEAHSNAHIRAVWIGAIAKRVYPSPTRRLSSTNQLDFFNSESELLRELQVEHSQLGDGEILVLDLCGVRRHWSKQSVAPLCHFFLEMNYTATSGRSAVVLWNVPTLAYEVFEEGVSMAAAQFSHLAELRRAALLIRDDGAARIFCGWPDAERCLGFLLRDGELSLDEMGVTRLSTMEQARFSRLVTENSHLFDWSGPTRVRLRSWPQALKERAWADGLSWLEVQLDTDHEQGGIYRRHPDGYYRLPSSGKLVQAFYSFGGFLSHHENCARICWLMAQLVRGIEKISGKQARHIITVTRSTSALARDVVDNYLIGDAQDRPRPICKTTVEDLVAFFLSEGISGPAIVITDVVSTGRLCEQIYRELPNVEWLGTAAILDTRKQSEAPARQNLELGINCFRVESIAAKPLLTLACRPVDKLDPATDGKLVGNRRITAIDRVNVSPIHVPKLPLEIKRIWHFLDRTPSALKVGHFKAGELHHHVYYISAKGLLHVRV